MDIEKVRLTEINGHWSHLSLVAGENEGYWRYVTGLTVLYWICELICTSKRLDY